MSRLRAGSVAAAIWMASSAWGSERFDHRGSVGLLLDGGPEFELGLAENTGAHAFADLGGSWAVGNNDNEVVLFARGLSGSPHLGFGFGGGYRSYFGYDRLKTFLDFQLFVQAKPFLALGPRVAGGFQYELSGVTGLFIGAAISAGGGQAVVLGGEVFAGIQFRSYLLEP